MKKNKVFRALVLSSLLRQNREREYFKEGSFAVSPYIIETRFRVLLSLHKEFGVRPTRELADNIDKNVSKLALAGLPVDKQREGAFWGIVFSTDILQELRSKTCVEKFTIENMNDLNYFFEFLDKIYYGFKNNIQKRDMISSVKNFGELLSPSSNGKHTPRLYTFDDRVSLPASYAATYWAEMKEEEAVH